MFYCCQSQSVSVPPWPPGIPGSPARLGAPPGFHLLGFHPRLRLRYFLRWYSMRILLLFEHSVQQRHCLFAAKYSINAGKYSYDIFVHSSLRHWLFVASYLSTALSPAQAHHDAEGSNEGTLYSRRSASLVAVFLLYLGFRLQSYHSVWRIWSFLLQSVTEKRKSFWGKKRVVQCSCRKKKGKYKRNTIEI